jgi:hypothetical protein
LLAKSKIQLCRSERAMPCHTSKSFWFITIVKTGSKEWRK